MEYFIIFSKILKFFFRKNTFNIIKPEGKYINLDDRLNQAAYAVLSASCFPGFRTLRYLHSRLRREPLKRPFQSGVAFKPRNHRHSRHATAVIPNLFWDLLCTRDAEFGCMQPRSA